MLKIKQVFMGVVAMLFLASSGAWAQVIDGQVAPNFTLTDSNAMD